jgi:hypothetical protein
MDKVPLVLFKTTILNYLNEFDILKLSSVRKKYRFLTRYINPNTSVGEKLLYIACKNSDDTHIRYIFENYNISDSVKSKCLEEICNYHPNTSIRNTLFCRNNRLLANWLIKYQSTSFTNSSLILQNACYSGNTELIKWIFKLYDQGYIKYINTRNALCDAAFGGNKDVVELLLTENEFLPSDIVAAVRDANYGNQPEIVSYLNSYLK